MFVWNYFMSSEFPIYSRKKTDDRYELIHTLEEGSPISRFKHEVYAYALGKNHSIHKCLYLYCGSYRVAKAIKAMHGDVPYLTITFSTTEATGDWDRSREQIPRVHKDMNWYQDTFQRHWVLQINEEPRERKYQNFRLNATI
jgi:hypothetical protein